MPRIIFLMGFLFVSVFVSRAQTPELIPYQAIARDADGNPLSQTNITLNFKIRQDSFSGLVVYDENHTLITDTRGFFTVNIGAGNVVIGDFSTINWAGHNHYMQILMNGSEIGNQQLLSVPYALHSKTAEQVTFTVSTSGDTLFSGPNSYVIIPGISDANYVRGCTDPTACNYSPTANLDNGSCLQVYDLCDDGNALTINDAINTLCECQGFFTGTTLLPGNSSCTTSPISVTGCLGETSLDYQGVNYSLVEVGGQCWFAENLTSTQYRDGTAIPQITSTSSWVSTTTGANCRWGNLAANSDVYGRLYNWYAVNNSKGLCPTGWHIPSDCDWMFLENTIGLTLASQIATGGRGSMQGGKLKSTNLWAAPNSGATDEFSFSALPGGYRNQTGSFRVLTTGAYYWTSSSAPASSAFFRSLLSTSGMIFRNSASNVMGMSVRCVRD